MEANADNLVLDIMAKIDKYGKFTDVSGVIYLFDRFLRTHDMDAQAFLLGRVVSKLRRIEKKFPTMRFAPDPPSIKELSSGIKIGSLQISDVQIPFMLSKEDLNKNILIAASVGHGKTSLVYNILSKLWQENITYILFDLKRDYRSLGLDGKTVYFNDLNLRINPLIPPKTVQFKQWAVHFADAFSHSFALLVGSRDFLLDSLIKFYELLDPNETPSIPDFITFLDKSPMNNEYIKVVKGRLKALMASTSIFNHKEGILLSDLEDKNIIFGIDAIGVPEQGFLLLFVLSFLFYENMNDPDKRNGLYRVVVIDDAHALLDANKERDYAMGISLLHQMISKMRELGVGFIFSDQQISSLIPGVIQNTNTKFIGRINLVEDFGKIFSFPLDPAVPEKISSLNTGEFLLLSNKIKPYGIVKIDRVRIPKDVDDVVLGIKPAKPTERKEPALSSKERSVLQEVSSFPTSNLSRHSKSLSDAMDENEFSSLKKSLIEKGLLDAVQIQLTEGKFSKFLYIPESSADKIKGLQLETWSKSNITKKILREVVMQTLRRDSVSFTEDEIGLLIKGLRKGYIVFMDDGSALSKLIETSFDRIIDVLDGSIPKEDILKNIESLSKPEHQNLNVIKFCEAYNFNLS